MTKTMAAKKKSDTTKPAAIPSGTSISVSGETRDAVKAKLNVLKAKAAAEGHKPASGGFIEYHPDAAGDQMFTACITFD